MTTPPSPSLYDRIGGEPGIHSLIEAFYGRVRNDAELAPFFVDSDLETLQRMQREFFAVALDGPAQYTGRPLSHVHHSLSIRPSHLGTFVEHLLACLQDLQLDEDDIQGIIARINTYADDVIGSGQGIDG
ncbi:MAG: group 1 truncated hemoglobin [Verrucomicrobiota bacterium]